MFLKDNVSTPQSEADDEERQSNPPKKRKVEADEKLVKPRKGASKLKASPGRSKTGKQVPKSSVSLWSISLCPATRTPFCYL
jgi:hypothetical protein